MKKLLLTALFASICTLVCAQDHIVLRNAEEINGKVLRISSTEVEYRKAENPDGPIYTLPVGEILFVKYENGKKEVFAEAPHNPKLVTGAGPAHMPDNNNGQQQDQFRHPRFRHNFGNFPHYQGELAIAYGLGIGMVADLINTDRIVIETTHGARISPYFFIGAGLNYNYLYTQQVYRNAKGIQNEGAGIIALFANGKGYYPISQKASIYFSLDLGAAIAAHGYIEGKEFYTAIGPGITLGNRQTKFCDFGIRFQHMGEEMNAILFRIGVGF